MKRILLLLLLALVAGYSLYGVTLIDPAGDGGFENGTSFPANGWTLVNHTLNNWYVGPLGANAGTNGAYISNDGGTTNAYTLTTAQTSHFYRDVTLPASDVGLLSFSWKGSGESTFDRLLVYVAPQTVTPVAGTPASSSTILEGATLLGMFNLQTTWQSANINLMGQTGALRLIFTWQNDASVGAQPPISIDNISLTTFTPIPLTGTKTIGPSGDYISFTTAINALNLNGVGTGGVTFNVADGTYTENPPVITVSGTAANPIVFQSPGGNTVLAPAGGTGTFGFKLDGADYITFDNIDINGPNTLVYGYWLANGAQHITIKNCSITVPYSSTSNYGIYSLGVTDGANSYSTFLNNNIVNPYNGIYFTGSSATGSEATDVNIQGNTLTGIRYYGIYLGYCLNSTVQYNNIGFYAGGTTSYNGIYVFGSTSICSIHHNTISGGYTSSSVYALYNSSGTSTWANNEVSNLYNTSSSAWYGMYASGTSTTWTNNSIHGITNTGTATVYGAYITTGNHQFNGNQLYDIATGGTTLYGMYVSGGTTHNIYGNKLYNLRYTGTGSGVVYGIHLTSATNNVYNNMIYDLQAAASTSSATAPAIRAISITGGTAHNVWYNSISLNSTGTNTAFSTATLYVSTTTSTIDLKNNIFVNNSVPGSAGRTVAFWKTSAGVANLSATSNKNIYYAGVPDATHLIGYFSTTGYQTIEEYKNMAATKDQGSYSENVPFISSVAPYNLHINPSITTRVEGNAIPIAEVTHDIDGDPRAATPDIGADEGTFTAPGGPPGLVTLMAPADEAQGINPITGVLSWSSPTTGGAPTSYYVYVATDISTIYSESFTEVSGTSLVLADVQGLTVGFSGTYYWAVQAHNNDGESDPDDPAFQIWSFSTCDQMTANNTLALGYIWPEDVINGIIPVQNLGTTPLTFTATGSPEFAFAPARYTIPAGGTYDLQYTFTVPATLGNYLGSITLTQTSPGSSNIVIEVTGYVTTEVIVGNGTAELNLPVDPFFGYSYSQSIYYPNELNYPDGYRIEKLYYYFNGYETCGNTKDFVIYMAHTTASTFATTTSWLPISGFTQVYNHSNIPQLQAGGYWMEFVLDTPFFYNGTDNLVIAVEENFAGYNSTSSYFYCTSTSGVNRSIRYSNDYTNPDPANPPTGTLVAGYPNTKFFVAPLPTNPVLSVTPNAWDFGSQMVNTTATKQFTISNSGAGTLVVSNITIPAGLPVTLTGLPTFPVSLTTGQTTTFNVQYAPTVAGPLDTQVTISDNRATTLVPITGMCVDPRITSLPHTQNFDGVTAPALPLGWTAYKSYSSSSLQTSTSYAQSPPNSVYMYNNTTTETLRLISPQIMVPMNSFKVTFYMRTYSLTSTLKVGTVSALDGTGVFTEIASLTPTATGAFTQYSVSFAAYTGTDQYLCFQHGVTATYQSLYIDNVMLEQLFPADLAATSLTGPTYGYPSVELGYNVTIYNNGIASQGTYSINLRDGTTTLVSMNVNTPLAPGASAVYSLNWVPAATGVYNLNAQVVLTGDGNASNDVTGTKVVHIYPQTAYTPVIGDPLGTTAVNSLPLNFYWKNSLSETIYTAQEMQMTSGTIQGVAYFNNFTQNINATPVKIWAKNTTATDLSTNWLDFTDYVLVFDGVVDFPVGVNTVYIPFTTPIAYTGGNFALRVNRPMDTVYYNIDNVFYYTVPQYVPNRSRYISSDSSIYDPLLPPTGSTLSSYIPLTAFMVTDAIPVSLTAPVVTITGTGTNVTLSWPAIANAYAYRIYGSDDPYTWPSEPTAVVWTNSYTTTATSKKFFKVTAVSSYRNQNAAFPTLPATLQSGVNANDKPQTRNKD